MILAIDQGTTGTTCLIVDGELRVIGRGYARVEQQFPQPGWVEQSPDDIWQSVERAAHAAVAAAGVPPPSVRAIGLTNQRETTVVWNRDSGRPEHAAIVWQDRRTAERVSALPAELIRASTGLVPDPYFSASKLEWILRRLGDGSRLRFGTVDSWLLTKLAGVHVTDPTNASRTMLFDIDSLRWSDDLLDLFGVPAAILPAVQPSVSEFGLGRIAGMEAPILAVAGDQQAALFGQGCDARGQAKATYGTGAFVLQHSGDERRDVEGLLTSLAVASSGARPGYVSEGSILAAGALIEWLVEIGVLDQVESAEALAVSVTSSAGVMVVPALAGLGAPFWDPEVRGTISGLSRGTTRAHIVRAALEGIAHRVADVIDRVGDRPKFLRADGGAAKNKALMQIQADLLGLPVLVSTDVEATGLGIAALAGIGAGLWGYEDALERLSTSAERYEPAGEPSAPERARWARALGAARTA